jgi:diphosphomevalonate decarboxylase
MTHCQETSPLYKHWPALVEKDIQEALEAIHHQDFQKLGEITEHSSESMHACMRASQPTLNYSLPETFELIHHIKLLRAEGLPVYFTQDAGPNLKILFLESEFTNIQKKFNQLNLDFKKL